MLTLQVRIKRDMKLIHFYSPEFWSIKQRSDSIFIWDGVITPRIDCKYSGLNINVEIVFPLTYPINPPQVRIVTPTNHACVSENGVIDLFGNEWTPTYTIGSIMLMILFNDYDHTKRRQIERHNIIKEELFMKTQSENLIW